LSTIPHEKLVEMIEELADAFEPQTVRETLAPWETATVV